MDTPGVTPEVAGGAVAGGGFIVAARLLWPWLKRVVTSADPGADAAAAELRKEQREHEQRWRDEMEQRQSEAERTIRDMQVEHARFSGQILAEVENVKGGVSRVEADMRSALAILRNGGSKGA